MREFSPKNVTVIRGEGSGDEERFEVEAVIQATTGFFAVDTPIYEGDIIEYDDPRGGRSRKMAAKVDVNDAGPTMAEVNHIAVTWGTAPPPRVAAIRRLGIEGLHPEVIAASGDLYTDEHYAQAVFEAFKALEIRVRQQSGLDASGRALMQSAFGGDTPPIDLSVESGQSGRDEQEGFRFIFMGVTQGVRNPKGHSALVQEEPQVALEYLAVASVLFRRLDDAAKKAGS